GSLYGCAEVAGTGEQSRESAAVLHFQRRGLRLEGWEAAAPTTTASATAGTSSGGSAAAHQSAQARSQSLQLRFRPIEFRHPAIGPSAAQERGELRTRVRPDERQDAWRPICPVAVSPMTD